MIGNKTKISECIQSQLSYRKTEPVSLSTVMNTWPGNTTTAFRQWGWLDHMLSKTFSSLKARPPLTKEDKVFISRIQLLQNPTGVDRLKTMNTHIEWDEKSKGVFIRKNSTAHSVALLCGFEPFTTDPIANGKYDKKGKL